MARPATGSKQEAPITQSRDHVHHPSIENGLVAIEMVRQISEQAKIVRGGKWSLCREKPVE
jgi:hypothetical protein